MNAKERRKRFVHSVDLHSLANSIWQEIGIHPNPPEILWWMTSKGEHGVAWPPQKKIRISIPWSNPHIVSIALLILHEMVHCIIGPDHDKAFKDYLTHGANRLWGVKPVCRRDVPVAYPCSEYDLDARIEAAMMRAWYRGDLRFPGEEVPIPSSCGRCGQVYPGPALCCKRPTRSLL